MLRVLTLASPRRFEYQADAFAVAHSNGAHLVEALHILNQENRSDFAVDPLYSAYHYSHPPLVERLRALDTHIAARLKKAI